MVNNEDEKAVQELEIKKGQIEARIAKLQYEDLVNRRLDPNNQGNGVAETQQSYSVKKTTETVNSNQGVYVCEMEEINQGERQVYNVRYQGMLKINGQFMYIDSTEKTVYGTATTRSFEAMIMSGNSMSKVVGCEELHRQIEDRFLTMKSEVKNSEDNVGL